MSRLRKSLLLKLILAFWLVSILGIAIVALLGGRVSSIEFNRVVNEARYQGLVDKLGDYYTLHGSLSGARYLLEEDRAVQGNQNREYLVLNAQGEILVSLAQHIPPGLPSPDFVRFGFPISANGQVAAYLIPLRPPRSLGEPIDQNIRRLNISLILGALVATLIALLFGWLMARNMIRPLRDLDAATRSIAQGDLEKKVSITTRDEIGALATSFNQMTESLRHSRDLRRQMTADIAHELRNPLSIILGNAEAISDGVLPATPESLEIIYDEARHLSRLVDDLRTLSLSESGELLLQRRAASPREIIERCVSANALRAADMGVTIAAHASQDLPPVNVDVERILQVLANLVDNSLKHTQTGGSILLSAAFVAEVSNGAAPAVSPGWVQISVTDSGVGIQPADLPYVFDRFYRGKQNSERLQDGSGLGLAISKALVELHGGRIYVESQPGKGTSISFKLPALSV